MTTKQLEALQVMARYSEIRHTLNRRYDIKDAWAFTPSEVNQVRDWYDKVQSYLVKREYRELKKIMEG